MSSPGNPSKALITALRQVLRPLVRFLLSKGITLPYLNQLLKEIYVEVAEQDFPLNEKPQTDSRINMLTGVHRKDVRRLREQDSTPDEIPPAVSLGAQVVSNWLTERRYQDRQGDPKSLPIRSKNARTVSFESLVSSVSRQDLRPRVVLDELARLGIVAIDNDSVTLIKDAFIPSRGEDEKLYYFAQNLRDHIAAAAANVDSSEAMFLERAVSYHGLTENDVLELESLSKKSANAALKEIDKRAKQLKKRSAARSDNNRRINFGTFFYSEPEDDD
ncbi:MAG: DUF6502 family protein [Pseudomonadota bacterium]